jgi:hypothetical protein
MHRSLGRVPDPASLPILTGWSIKKDERRGALRNYLRFERPHWSGEGRRISTGRSRSF